MFLLGDIDKEYKSQLKLKICVLGDQKTTFTSDFHFALQPFLPLSDSGVIYDSDESIHSDEEEDDAFLSDIQIQEHKDANSYRLEEIAILLE